MDCSTSGFPVPHQLLEFAQVHIHWISDAIQPSSSSVTLFCLQSFPASGSFPMSQLLASGGQSTGASALASVFPKSIQGWSPLRFTSLISLLSKGLSRVFSSNTTQKYYFFSAQPFLWSDSIDSPFLYFPCSWNHSKCGLLCPASSSWFNVMEVH